MKNKRIMAVIGIVILFIILCVSCAFLGYMIVGGEMPGGSAVRDDADISMSTVPSCNVMLPDIYTDSMRRVDVGNVDSRASIADKLRENTDRNLQKFDVEVDSNNVTRYSIDGSVVRVDIPSGTNRFECGRSYYINNGYLYLADFYTGVLHDKMYFSNDIMFRYTKSDGTTSDNNFGDSTYCYVGNFALNESKDFVK
jgi:hypothetical protein